MPLSYSNLSANPEWHFILTEIEHRITDLQEAANVHIENGNYNKAAVIIGRVNELKEFPTFVRAMLDKGEANAIKEG